MFFRMVTKATTSIALSQSIPLLNTSFIPLGTEDDFRKGHPIFLQIYLQKKYSVKIKHPKGVPQPSRPEADHEELTLLWVAWSPVDSTIVIPGPRIPCTNQACVVDGDCSAVTGQVDQCHPDVFFRDLWVKKQLLVHNVHRNILAAHWLLDMANDEVIEDESALTLNGFSCGSS